jgi:hypothetical protein
MSHRPAVLVVALVALLVFSAPAHAAAERLEPRVVVSDGKRGKLHVFTLDGERRGSALSLPADTPAYLTRLEDGRHVAAVQYEGDRVSVLDGGSWTEPHGDHHHSYAARPRLTPFRLTAPQPTHVVSHGGTVAIFADGAGVAHLYRLGDLRRRAGATTELQTGKPHHGVALTLGERVLVSAPDPSAADGELPIDVSVRDAAGAELARLGSCPELHGEAAGADWAAFACADGVISARLENGQVTASKLPYPPQTEPEQRAWGLQPDHSGRYLIGDFGARSLVRVDRATGATTTLALPAKLGSFAVDGSTIHALTADGRVHRLDVRTGKRSATRRVTRRFDPDSRQPTPQIATGADHVAISEPARRRVHIIRARTLKRAAGMRVAGRPQQLTIVGAPPR